MRECCEEGGGGRRGTGGDSIEDIDYWPGHYFSHSQSHGTDVILPPFSSGQSDRAKASLSLDITQVIILISLRENFMENKSEFHLVFVRGLNFHAKTCSLRSTYLLQFVFCHKPAAYINIINCKLSL